MSATPDRLRTAFKFSLWTWLAYWPGCGVLLLAAGMGDPVSLAVVLGLLAQSFLLFACGALDVDPRLRRGTKEFLLDRPLYLVASLVVLLALLSVLPSAPSIGLAVLSGLQLAGLALVATRLRAHLRATGKGVWASRGDQVLLVTGLIGFAVLLVFLDAVGQFAGASTGSPATMVAVLNWLNLAYPPLLLLASRPFREPLRNPFRRRGERAPAVAAAAQPVAQLAE